MCERSECRIGWTGAGGIGGKEYFSERALRMAIGSVEDEDICNCSGNPGDDSVCSGGRGGGVEVELRGVMGVEDGGEIS